MRREVSLCAGSAAIVTSEQKNIMKLLIILSSYCTVFPMANHHHANNTHPFLFYKNSMQTQSHT